MESGHKRTSLKLSLIIIDCYLWHPYEQSLSCVRNLTLSGHLLSTKDSLSLKLLAKKQHQQLWRFPPFFLRQARLWFHLKKDFMLGKFKIRKNQVKENVKNYARNKENLFRNRFVLNLNSYWLCEQFFQLLYIIVN